MQLTSVPAVGLSVCIRLIRLLMDSNFGWFVFCWFRFIGAIPPHTPNIIGNYSKGRKK